MNAVRIAVNVVDLLTGGDGYVPKHSAKDAPVKIVRRDVGHAVYAPKCPHGHFLRWAERNCKGCAK
jgi:hypothetical protein